MLWQTQLVQESAPMDLDGLFEQASGETAERQVVEAPAAARINNLWLAAAAC